MTSLTPSASVTLPDGIIGYLNGLFRDSEAVYLKKLALNDWQWAENVNAHQAGFYIPKRERDSGFFPVLQNSETRNGNPIRDTAFEIEWVQHGEVRTARLINYLSKGEETHLTGVPKAPLLGIPPSSTLVIGKRKVSGFSPSYYALIVYAETQAAEWLRELFALRVDYHSEVLDPAVAFKRQAGEAADFLALAFDAFAKGRFADFASSHAILPDTRTMARMAQDAYLANGSVRTLNPFMMEAPGDVLRTLSQDIEWKLFQGYERKKRSVEIITEIFGADPRQSSIESAFKGVVQNFDAINRILLSAAQQRKSRAGYSLEQHLERMLIEGGIPYQAQAILERKKRPDFLLPSLAVFERAATNSGEALVLSAKSSLRERWKQVRGEAGNGDLYLATLDASVALNAIEDMGKQGIRLVVPESLKNSKETLYAKRTEVISFAEFFQDEIRRHRFPIWKKLGVLSA